MSYFHDYLDYSTGNEAPEQFHVWAAYTGLSVAVARRCWLPFEDTAIYPNLYTMFVGGAGNGKSWAMMKLKRLLAEVPDTQVSGSLETPPGLWRYMSGNLKLDPPVPSPVMKVIKWPDGRLREVHPMTLIANEFVNFISLDEKGWINALNDIYDEDVYHYRTKNQGEDTLIGPYIVLLGALTTEVSNDLQKARIISTGLARRTIFQYGERQWHNPHAKPRYEDFRKEARARCLDHLKAVRKLSGGFEWTQEVDDFWKNWYDPHLASVPDRPPSTQGWFSTKPIQVLKLAMLTALGKRADLTLTVADFEVALGFLAKMEEDLEKIFGGVGRNELAAVAVKIFETMNQMTKPLTMGGMIGQFFTFCKPPHELNEVINYLVITGKIVRTTLKVDGKVLTDAYATPRTAEAYAAETHAEVVRLADGVPIVSTPATVSVADPSSVPSALPTNGMPEVPVAAPPADETGGAEPPTPETKEG